MTLNIGDKVSSDDNVYIIQQKLGKGSTAKVWKAKNAATLQRVALKVLRDDVGEILKNNFWLEAKILGELNTAERKAKDGLHNVPFLIEKKKGEDGVQFLVLEFVEGEPLDKLTQDGKYLDEQIALLIADRMLRVLNLLHSKVHRTYTDLQLQNIWYQKQIKNTIMVMDWNHVSAPIPAGQELPLGFGADDLSLFGTYFYRMLTGKGASEGGETEWELEQRAGARWTGISLGARHIIVKALHLNSTQRYQTAKEFRKDVQNLISMWKSDALDLFIQASDQLTEMGDELPEENVANNIAEKLSIVLLLDASYRSQVEKYQRQLEEKIGSVSVVWKSGEQYYESGYYESAYGKWRAEVDYIGKLKLWRWVMLAQTGMALGKEVFQSVKKQLEEVVAFLERHEPNGVDSAESILEGLSQRGVQAEGVRALNGEVAARLTVTKARIAERRNEQGDWQEASNCYRDALIALEAVPYKNQLMAEEGWSDLSERIEQLEERINDRKKTTERITHIQSSLSKNFEEGVYELEDALRRDSQNRRLVELCLTEAESRLNDNDAKPFEAVSLLEIAVLLGQTLDLSDILQERLREAREKVQEAKRTKLKMEERAEWERQNRKIFEQIQLAVKKEHWYDLQTLLNENPSLTACDEDDFLIALQNLLIERFHAIVFEEKAVRSAALLIQVLELLDREGHSDREKQYEELVTELKKDEELWEQELKRWVDSEQQNKTPDQYQTIITIVQRARPLAEGNDELVAWLDDKILELKDIMNVQGHQERVKEEAEKLIQEGKDLLVAFTQPEIGQGRSKFEDVETKLARIQNDSPTPIQNLSKTIDSNTLQETNHQEPPVSSESPFKSPEADVGIDGLRYQAAAGVHVANGFGDLEEELQDIRQNAEEVSGWCQKGLATSDADLASVYINLRERCDDIELRAKEIWQEAFKDDVVSGFDAIKQVRDSIPDVLPKPDSERDSSPKDKAWLLPLLLTVMGIVAVAIIIYIMVRGITTTMDESLMDLAPLVRQEVGTVIAANTVSPGGSISLADVQNQVVIMRDQLSRVENKLATVIVPKETPLFVLPAPTLAPPTPAPAVPLSQQAVWPNVTLDPLPEPPLYDLPTLTGRISPSMQIKDGLFVVNSGENLSVEGSLEVFANGIIQSGVAEIDSDGNFTWKPSSDDATLPAANYAIMLRVIAKDKGIIDLLETPIPLVISPVPATALLQEARLRSDPILQTSKIISPQPLLQGVQVNVMGYKTVKNTNNEDRNFLMIMSGRKGPWWILESQVESLSKPIAELTQIQ